MRASKTKSSPQKRMCYGYALHKYLSVVFITWEDLPWNFCIGPRGPWHFKWSSSVALSYFTKVLGNLSLKKANKQGMILPWHWNHCSVITWCFYFQCYSGKSLEAKNSFASYSNKIDRIYCVHQRPKHHCWNFC